MPTSLPSPQYIVDQAGRRKQVILSVRDYERMLAAWEDVVDAKDFATAKRTAKTFKSSNEIKTSRKRGTK